MSTSHALLGLLEREPSHGYELKQRFDRLFSPNRPLPFGHVYATLARLERDGRVTAGAAERVDGPDRRRYAITADGEHELARWVAAPLMPEPHLQAALYTKVVLALLSGRSATDVLDVQRGEHLRLMRVLTRRKAGADLATQLVCDHALFHLEADLRWLELTAARVDQLGAQVRAGARS